MNHPEPPTKPCPGCGEDLPSLVADAYAWLYAQGRGHTYGQTIESAIQAYGPEKAEPLARAVVLHVCAPAVRDLIAAIRHRLHDE